MREKNPSNIRPHETSEDEPEKFPLSPSFPVVGIGASAGGLEAIIELFECLPPDTGVAFLVVQHMSTDRTSMLAEIISKKTPMLVTQALEDQSVEPNHVYVIPPDTSMTILEGKLILKRRDTAENPPMPVDDLFYSLAEYMASNAIGVTLSGTGSDGALGIQAIKRAGGITFAQDKVTAKFGGMPEAAIRLDTVDFILPPEQIAHEIVRIASHPFLASASLAVPDTEGEATNDEYMKRIFSFMNDACNMDFTHYKSGTVKRRLARRMALQGQTTLADYVTFLEATPGEANALCQDFLIHVTSFFRDPESFEALSKFVFPHLLKKHPAGQLRIWVPGCATGEEVYSIAMCLLEYLGENVSSWEIQIFGTDASEAALETARAGLYPENITRNVSAERLQRFFIKRDGHYQISKSVRDLCIFARHNITRDPPFSRLNLISCRNLLIYLGAVLQKRVMPLFHYALNPDGVLMLGPSENISGFSDLFSLTETRKFKIYIKKDVPKRTQIEYIARSSPDQRPRKRKAANSSQQEATGAERHRHEADVITRTRYVPAAVLCDEQLNIQEFRGDTSLYLTQPTGAPHASLQKLARPGLMPELNSAIQQARREAATTRREGIRIETPQGMRNVTLEINPLRHADVAAEDSWFLIFFEPTANPVKAGLAQFLTELLEGVHLPSRGSKALLRAKDNEIAQLRREIEASREHTGTMMEEHELAKEELQASEEEMLSSNEEFQSTNEELETAKEELQSTNEELNTTNDELRHRNQELSNLNDKIQQTLDYAEAIIRTVPQPLLVLDVNLYVLRANEAFYEAFKTTKETTEKTVLYELGNGQWDIPELRKFLGAILSKSSAMKNYEITHTFPDIGRKTMRLNGAHLVWDDHSLILLAIEDITEYKTALDTLKRDDQSKDEFLAMLAHELRNPLAPIQSALELLNHGGAGEEAEKNARLIMGRQLQKEIRLVDDLLDISRITSGSITLRQDTVDLTHVIDLAVEGARPHFDTRGQKFTVEMRERTLAVKGDALRIEQVVSNVLINAAKYTPQGGRISLTLERKDDTAVIIVADNGIGISPALLPRIFDLFVQAEMTLDRSAGGLGIGLTLVRRLVELQGGTVEARSPGQNKGSEFVIRLPLVTGGDATLPAAPSSRPKNVPFTARRILVIDDNVDAAKICAQLLEVMGHITQSAMDGLLGIDAARKFKPEVVFLDIGLPGIDGYEVARRLRNMPETKGVLLIALSGYGKPEDKRKSKEAGFDHHLVKPATMEDFQKVIP